MSVYDELNDSYLEVERREGNLLWLKGHKLPYRGVTTPEVLEDVNKIKSLLLRGKIGQAHGVAWKLGLPRDLLPAARAVLAFVHAMGYYRLAPIVCLIVQYDEAYRFRLQDIANETNEKLLTGYPRFEVKRLLAIWAKRDHTAMREKFKYMAYFLPFLLAVPPVKRAFIKAVENVGIRGLYPDEIDLYWMRQKTDYDYCGIRHPHRT